MNYNIDYKPKNRIANPCEFLTEEKVIQYRENSRHKMTSLMYREHRCLKKDKIIAINHDCVNCDFYRNYVEIIEQQAQKIEELERKIRGMYNDK